MYVYGVVNIMSDFVDYLKARREQIKEILPALISASIFAIYYMFLHFHLSTEWVVNNLMIYGVLLSAPVIAMLAFVFLFVLYKDYEDFKKGEEV